MFPSRRGFTLIELLVVIAIIGILAGIVLASLGNARSGGTDAKIKAQLSNMRSQAELYTNGSATAFAIGTCATTAGKLFETANSGLGTLLNGMPTLTGSRCVSSAGLPSAGATWAIAIPLTSTANTFWCVDSTAWSSNKNKSGTAYSSLTTAITDTTGTICN